MWSQDRVGATRRRGTRRSLRAVVGIIGLVMLPSAAYAGASTGVRVPTLPPRLTLDNGASCQGDDSPSLIDALLASDRAPATDGERDPTLRLIRCGLRAAL